MVQAESEKLFIPVVKYVGEVRILHHNRNNSHIRCSSSTCNHMVTDLQVARGEGVEKMINDSWLAVVKCVEDRVAKRGI